MTHFLCCYLWFRKDVREGPADFDYEISNDLLQHAHFVSVIDHEAAKLEICIDLQASAKSFLRLIVIVIKVFIFLLHLFSFLNTLAYARREFADKWRDICCYYLLC